MPPKTKKVVSTTRCPKGSRKNTKTGKCVSKNVPVINVTNSKCSTVKCSRDKICNPDSGKCVLRTGAIGKKLLEATGVIKKVEKKIEKLNRMTPVSENVKRRVEDLGSDDPDTRKKAEKVLLEEGKKNEWTWEYIIKIASMVMPIILSGAAVAIVLSGKARPVEKLVIDVAAFQKNMELAPLVGKKVARVKMMKDALKWISFGTRRLPEKYMGAYDILKSMPGPLDTSFTLDVEGIEKVASILGKDPDVCKPGTAAFQTATRFYNVLHGINVRMKGSKVAKMLMDSFRDVKLSCAR